MAEISGFKQANAQLASLTQQQTDLQRAVASGDLWMEAGIAERAASRCEQAHDEINQLLNDTRRRIKRLPFGENHDGNKAADRFDEAARDFMNVMAGARTVMENMAATYRAAGRTMTEADAAGQQTFKGQPG